MFRGVVVGDMESEWHMFRAPIVVAAAYGYCCKAAITGHAAMPEPAGGHQRRRMPSG